MWQIAHDLQRLDATVLTLGYALETIGHQEIAIKKYEQVILSQDTVIKSQSFQLETLTVISDLERQKGIEENKHIRKERNKFMLTTFGELIVILILLF